MNEKHQPDWDPRSEDVLRDQLAAYDDMRERCPVAYSEFMQWSVFRHEDVVRVIQDHETFSSAVSQHLSVPSGMDPPEHTVYRKIIEPYFSPKRMNVFEPICRDIVTDLTSSALARGELELMADVSVPFAVRGQCAFLGWSPDLEKPLADWTMRNYEATLAQDRQAMSDIARELEGFIDEMLEARLQAEADPEDDITASLMHDKVWGRPLSNEEIASIARTWTVGEIGSIAASVGILVHYLAEHVELQNQLRAEPSLLAAAIDEILRIHDPLVASRRVTTCPVEIAGCKIEAGERISLNWVSANRDGRVFEEPTTFRWDRDPADNLLYGAGIHVCPGAPLARMEMRVFMEELLKRTTQIGLIPNQLPTKAVYPASGFAALPVKFE
ncbi:MAG: cytochrome P450 [Abditibacteriaceae bacterium]